MRNFWQVKKLRFFESVEWEKVERKEVEVPFRPELDGEMDLRYFDREFTQEATAETVMNGSIEGRIRQGGKYQQFTYISPTQI
jgi:hypothetical protein